MVKFYKKKLARFMTIVGGPPCHGSEDRIDDFSVSRQIVGCVCKPVSSIPKTCNPYKWSKING